MPNFADEVTEIAEEIFGRREFSHYTTHKRRILHRLATDHLDEIENKVQVERLQVSEAEEAQRAEWQIKGRRALLRGIVLALATATMITEFLFLTLTPPANLAAWLGVDEKNSWIFTHRQALAVWLVIGTVFLGLATIGQLWRRNVARRLSMTPVELARGVYERALTSATQEAVASSINDELGPEGIVAFPTHAPRLVELDTSQVTPSRTANYIKESYRKLGSMPASPQVSGVMARVSDKTQGVHPRARLLCNRVSWYTRVGQVYRHAGLAR